MVESEVWILQLTKGVFAVRVLETLSLGVGADVTRRGVRQNSIPRKGGLLLRESSGRRDLVILVALLAIVKSIEDNNHCLVLESEFESWTVGTSGSTFQY